MMANNQIEEMSEEQLVQKKKSEQIIREIYKNEEVKQVNLIVKAGTAGALETILKEVNKIISGSDNIMVVDSGVGQFTEAELESAGQNNAILIGFDLNWTEQIENHIEADGIVCKAHKLIFKLTENVKQLVEDMKGNAGQPVVNGVAHVKQMFEIKVRGQQSTFVAGVVVKSGEINRNSKFRIRRGT